MEIDVEICNVLVNKRGASAETKTMALKVVRRAAGQWPAEVPPTLPTRLKN